MRRIFQKVLERGIFTTIVLLGPVAVAGSHFLVSLLLIPHVPPAEYGTFAFGMVLFQICTGISDGLIGSPMAVRMAGKDNDEGPVFAIVNLLYCLLAGLIVFAVLLFLTEFWNALFFSTFAFLATFRWFGRGYVIITGHRYLASLSDLVYASLLVAMAGTMLLADKVELPWIFGAMAIATAIAGLFLGKSFAGIVGKSFGFGRLISFLPIWREQAAWSVTAVAANAATIESHVFVVTFLAGPQAFAPIAIATLCFRPNLIGIYSLSQYERPQISKHIAAGDTRGAKRQTMWFIYTTLGLWSLNLLAVIAAVYLFRGMFVSNDYDITTVIHCVIAIAIVMLVRSIRQPLLTFTQAINKFRSIASVTLMLAPVSILCASAGLLAAGSAGSIYGMLIADILLLAFIFRLFKSASTVRTEAAPA